MASLPSWGRGLKHLLRLSYLAFLPSLPSWGRGLKLDACDALLAQEESLPSWGRGLKQSARTTLLDVLVAPFVGAWIETPFHEPRQPSRFVAPFVGAWIETVNEQVYEQLLASLPSWGRGLKLVCRIWSWQTTGSLPSWGRGLKHFEQTRHNQIGYVAPFVGAWIETSSLGHVSCRRDQVAPFVGAWIETILCDNFEDKFASLPSWGRGLKPSARADRHVWHSRSLRGGVD